MEPVSVATLVFTLLHFLITAIKSIKKCSTKSKCSNCCEIEQNIENFEDKTLEGQLPK